MEPEFSSRPNTRLGESLGRIGPLAEIHAATHFPSSKLPRVRTPCAHSRIVLGSRTILHRRVATRQAGGGARNPRAPHLPWLERLETRLVLSSISWTDPNGGDWDTAGNWSSDTVPTASDDVTINIPVTNPITHGTSIADAVDSITSQDPITLSAGSLAVATSAALGASLTLSGGTINGGTIDLTDGAALIGTSLGGTLNGVTLDGDLDLTANGAGLTITDGLTLDGTAALAARGLTAHSTSPARRG